MIFQLTEEWVDWPMSVLQLVSAIAVMLSVRKFISQALTTARREKQVGSINK